MPGKKIIGNKLRVLRTSLGISQSDLADKAGVSFQQIQKYEKGVNRISADRLYDIAKILKVDIREFFEGMDGGSKYRLAENKDGNSLKPSNVIDSKESITLLREYYKIKDPATRKKVLDFIKKMSG